MLFIWLPFRKGFILTLAKSMGDFSVNGQEAAILDTLFMITSTVALEDAMATS
jgi:hypothetical protein